VNNYGGIAGSGVVISPHVVLTTAQHFQTYTKYIIYNTGIMLNLIH